MSAGLLKKYGVRPDKRLGQNFLIDMNVVEKIVCGAKINKETTVLEIGGGVGTMTAALVDAAKEVIVIEIDPKMCEILKNEISGNLTVINADVLKTDIGEILDGKTNVRVCANLPYYITTPIIMFFLEKVIGVKSRFNETVKSLTFMMQKEVADRITAISGTKNYGAITPAVNYYADASILLNVPPHCFVPMPDVFSSVVQLDILDKGRVSPKDAQLMFSVIKASFGQRRKTLLNAVSSGLDFDKETLSKCILKCGISPTVRGEKLGLNEFCSISDEIFNIMYKNN